MSVFDAILEAMRTAFADGAGADQDKLAEIIGQPVDDEIRRVDQVNEQQSSELTILTADIALLKAQMLAIINNQAIPIDPGVGTPPADPVDGPTTEPILKAPEGAYKFTDFNTAVDIITSRIRAGRTNYEPQIIGDTYRKYVEDAIQIVVGTLSGTFSPAQGPGGIPLSTIAGTLAEQAIANLKRDGYLG